MLKIKKLIFFKYKLVENDETRICSICYNIHEEMDNWCLQIQLVIKKLIVESWPHIIEPI